MNVCKFVLMDFMKIIKLNYANNVLNNVKHVLAQQIKIVLHVNNYIFNINLNA